MIREHVVSLVAFAVAVLVVIGVFVYRTSHVQTLPPIAIIEYIDPDTKVHYLVDHAYGGMTVRYNVDGSIMTD